MSESSCMKCVAVGFLALALGACVATGPGDEAAGEPDDVGTDEEMSSDDEVTNPDDVDIALAPESVGGTSNAIACGGNGNWCLARCKKTGNVLHVVGRWDEIVGSCSTAGEEFCYSMHLRYRTLSCWGHL